MVARRLGSRQGCWVCAGANVLVLPVCHHNFNFLNVQAALSLPRRPMLHGTPLIALYIVLVELFGVLRHDSLAHRHSRRWFIATALLTHHIRDAWRRGLWMWPLADWSLQVPYFVYMAIIAVWPWLLLLVKSRHDTGRHVIHHAAVLPR